MQDIPDSIILTWCIDKQEYSETTDLPGGMYMLYQKLISLFQSKTAQ